MINTATKKIGRLLALSLLLIACNSAAEKKSGPLKGYDLNSPERFVMPGSLIEISGITFNHNVGDVVYAIQDEEGKFFRLNWGVKKQTHAKFSKSGDYEDVAILHDKVVVLKSNGSLYSFNLSDANQEDIDNVQEWKKILPEGEYESMCADEAASQLYVLCKNCDIDKKTEGVTGYILSFNDSAVAVKSTFYIDPAGAADVDMKVSKGLRPSAMAKNPVTRQWYIISSVNKTLFIADEQWKITQSVSLSSNTFNQPEGMAFDNAGNLYISNEGDDITEGNILKFTRQNK